MSVSLHILLATIGKNSIFRMLNSLKMQLTKEDYITVVFDAKDVDNVFNKVKTMLDEDFICKTNLIYEEKNLGYWGHGIRNKHNDFKEGDYILHADDDDRYVDGAIDFIKKNLVKDKINIFKMKKNNDQVCWSEKKVRIGNISTQCGVIPISMNKDATWENFYGGDGAFYEKLCSKYPHVFIDKIIYTMKKCK